MHLMLPIKAGGTRWSIWYKQARSEGWLADQHLMDLVCETGIISPALKFNLY